MTSDWTLEPATPEDVDALAALEVRCASHPWTRRHFEDALRGGAGQHVRVGRHPASGLVGFCVWQEVADEAHVHDLAVDPAWRRRGLGRALIVAALAEADARGARRAFLDVRAGNEAARGLYASLGFRESGRRSGYYREPTEDAVLLEAALPLSGVAFEP